jgi:hypothetical protein
MYGYMQVPVEKRNGPVKSSAVMASGFGLSHFLRGAAFVIPSLHIFFAISIIYSAIAYQGFLFQRHNRNVQRLELGHIDNFAVTI